METTPEKAVAALLRETETAHGDYETNVLGGIYDEEWPAWYAAYLLDHGLSDYLPGAESLDVANLAAELARLAADYERGEQSSPWPDVYAQGIVAHCRGTPGGKESPPQGPQKFKLFKPFKHFKLFTDADCYARCGLRQEIECQAHQQP